MPVAGSDDPQRAGQQATALRHTLHERGLRMTPQRQLVLDAVRALDHATPEQICAQVQRTAPAVNITTIYRTLDLLDASASSATPTSATARPPTRPTSTSTSTWCATSAARSWSCPPS